MKVSFETKNLSKKNRISIYTMSTYFVIVILFLCLRLMSSFGLFNSIPSVVRSVITTIFIQIILMFTIAIFMFGGLAKRKPKEVLKFYGYKKVPLKAVLIALVLGLIVFFLNSYVATFFSEILRFLGFRSTASDANNYPVWLFLLNILFTALLPAVCEETTHRGLLLRGSIMFGSFRAIIISGLLFGLLHMNIQQFFYATLIGFYLGYLALHSDSIFPGMIIHFCNNALSVFFAFASANNLAIANFVNNLLSLNSGSLLAGVVFHITFVTLLIIGLVGLTKKIIQITSDFRLKDLQTHIYSDLVKQEYYDRLDNSKQAVSGAQPEQQTQVIYMENMFFDKNIELGYMTNLDRELIEEKGEYKFDIWTVVLMSLCIAIGAAVTIFTFIWGIL